MGIFDRGEIKERERMEARARLEANRREGDLPVFDLTDMSHR